MRNLCSAPSRGGCGHRGIFKGVAATLALLTFLSAKADDAQSLLAAADGIRYPEGSFSVRVALLEYRGGYLTGSSALTVYSKPVADSGQYNNLVRFIEPARDAGKLLLRNGMDLWFYDPASRASVRISPQARLLGQASNGDVMSTNLASDYTAALVGRETIEDDARQPRVCHRLRLTARRQDVPYAQAEYWIDETSQRPVRVQFLTAEGRLLKTAWFRRYQPELGRERPTETVIVDGLDPKWITVMRSSDFQRREIPQSWLQRDFLPRFGGDEH